MAHNAPFYTIFFSQGKWRKHYEDIGHLDKDSRAIKPDKFYQETNWKSISSYISWNNSFSRLRLESKVSAWLYGGFCEPIRTHLFSKFNLR